MTKIYGDFGKRKLERRRIGERENFFAFQFCFEKIFDESIGRFWKTKVGGKKNWREGEKESELNLENFFAFQLCFGDFGKRKLEGRRIGERERENWIREI